MMDERVEEAVRQHKQKVEWHQTESPTETVESTTTTAKNRISTPKRTWKVRRNERLVFSYRNLFENKGCRTTSSNGKLQKCKINIFIVIWQLWKVSQSLRCKGKLRKLPVTKKKPANFVSSLQHVTQCWRLLTKSFYWFRKLSANQRAVNIYTCILSALD